MMIVLRLLHVGLGVFWAGSLLFIALFLEPSIRAALPESGKVMQQLAKRRLLDIMPLVAALTLLTGIELYRQVSGGFALAWIGTPLGLALTLGGAAALVAFGVGVGVLRPAQLRMLALAPAAQQAEGAERERIGAAVEVQRRRAMIAGRLVASLLALSVAGMAVARYL